MPSVPTSASPAHLCCTFCCATISPPSVIFSTCAFVACNCGNRNNNYEVKSGGKVTGAYLKDRPLWCDVMRPRNRQTFLRIQYQIANSWLTNTPFSNTSLVFLVFTQFSHSFRIGKYRLGFCKTTTQLPEESGCTAITTLKCPVTWSRTEPTTSTSTYLIELASISGGAVYTKC